MNDAIFFLHALSSIHFGVGRSSGSSEQACAREAASRLPNAPASGIKGPLREECRTQSPDKASLEKTKILFGPERAETEGRDQGALLFSDGLLLAMPVTSYVGDFAWVTSPVSLARLRRELLIIGFGRENVPPLVQYLEAGNARLTKDSVVRSETFVYLHEFKLNCGKDTGNGDTNKKKDPCTHWADWIAEQLFPGGGDTEYFRTAFAQRFVIVSDADLVVLSELAADARARNALDGGQVANLWSEEAMPAETVFWGTVSAVSVPRDTSLVSAKDSLSQFLGWASSLRTVQMGGKASVGKGDVRLVCAVAPVASRGQQHG